MKKHVRGRLALTLVSAAVTISAVTLALAPSSFGRMLWGNSDLRISPSNASAVSTTTGVFNITDEKAETDGRTTVMQSDVAAPYVEMTFTADAAIYESIAEYGLRARAGAKCGTQWPRLVVAIDPPGGAVSGLMRQLYEFTVTSTTYGDYSANMNNYLGSTYPAVSDPRTPGTKSMVSTDGRATGTFAPGTYRMRVYFANPEKNALCTATNGHRKVYLDWIGVRPSTTHKVLKSSTDNNLPQVAVKSNDPGTEDDWSLTLNSRTPTGATVGKYSVERRFGNFYKRGATQAALRIKGETCGGVAPKFRVYINGVAQNLWDVDTNKGLEVSTGDHPDRYWRWGISNNFAYGYHTFRIEFVNPGTGVTSTGAACQRSLHVDWVGMGLKKV